MRQLVTIVSIFALSIPYGCTTIEKTLARDSEQLLSASGFTMKLADTPEKLAHLKTLTQRKVVPHERDGKTYFVYADALYCGCMYVGNQEDYKRYKKMVIRKRVADINRGASVQWRVLGPSGW